MSPNVLNDASAVAALQNLVWTQRALNATQQQISSGLHISTAADDAAYWSISTRLASDTGALSAVSDALSLGASVVGTATAAVTSTPTLLDNLRDDLVTAQQPGTSRAAVQTDVTAQQQSLVAVLSSASFNGVNLLDGSQVSGATFVSSFTRNASGVTSVQTLSVNTVGTTGTQVAGSGGILAVAMGSFSGTGVAGPAGGGSGAGNDAAGSLLAVKIATATASDLSAPQADVDKIITQVTGAGTQLGMASSVITNQQTYVAALSNAVTSGLGSRIDADINVASTRLQALQTQQQLGIQALSIADGNSQFILKLFGAS